MFSLKNINLSAITVTPNLVWKLFNFTLEDILNFSVSDELISLCENSEDVAKRKLY